MSAAAAAPAAPRRPRAFAAAPGLPLAVARGAPFLALVLFGALHWMAMLEPPEPGRALALTAVAALAAGLLLAAARLPGAAAQLAAVAALVPLAALAGLAGGLGRDELDPRGWGELGGAVARGLASLPGVRVPYRGIDPDVRMVLPLGASVLVLLAAALAFWPRRRTPGRPLAALVVLVLLYVIPAVALDFHAEFLRGALLAMLVVAFARLEKLARADAGPAALIAAAVALAALVAAPALDRAQPWWDYETWALETAAAKSTAYDWQHSYGPLTWPRDGRELLRVKARFPAYWKAENLDGFDGQRWVRDDPSVTLAELPGRRPSLARWTEDVRFSLRNLRSEDYIAAGYALEVSRAPSMPVRTFNGAFTAARMLRRGDSYSARVYVPQPTERQREAAGTDFPPDLARYLAVDVPVGHRLESTPATVIFPHWGQLFGSVRAAPPALGSAADVAAMLRTSFYARTWALARRLRRGAPTPDAYVQRVLAYLGRGFTYTETPPPSAQNLDGFLFDARTGYCQQFSGAMALLLRMGGVPARVATGFTSGALDRKTGEYVVRDFDAHSWVEAYYPGYGWVTFDPTPAIAPARSQPDEGSGAGGDTPSGRVPSFSGDNPASRGDGTSASAGAGAAWWGIAMPAAAAALLAAAAAGLVARRRRGPRAAVQELERALRRAHRPPAPATTLRALEDGFASPAAAGYVRAVREARYGGRRGEPTAAQRRGLRAELGRDGGVRGRLRSWWALPPV